MPHAVITTNGPWVDADNRPCVELSLVATATGRVICRIPGFLAEVGTLAERATTIAGALGYTL